MSNEVIVLSDSIAVEWETGKSVEGCVRVSHGKLVALSTLEKKEQVGESEFKLSFDTRPRLELILTETQVNPGAFATLVTVENNQGSFSFFVRDVNRKCPIWIPDCSVMVIPASDHRSYAEIASSYDQPEFKTSLQRIDVEAEESFENAKKIVRRQPSCPTWLGLSRDMRSFLLGFRENGEVWDWIQPQYHSTPVTLPENDSKPVRYNFFIGRGVGCTQPLRRWLEDGFLPIVQAEMIDGDICYQITAFSSLEITDLLNPETGASNLRGTHYLVADSFGFGNMQTEEQAKQREQLLPQEVDRDEETVLYMQIKARNTAQVPRYAWIKTPVPNAFHVGTTLLVQYQFQDGFGFYPKGESRENGVFLAARMNSRPMPQEEMAVLLQPNEEMVCDIYIPHRPLSPRRAEALARQDFNNRLEEVRNFWNKKLSSAAQVELPERRIQEMLRAGLLHLDLVTYGLEPNDVTAACIGVYCPIGSESSPIIQFFDSMGCHYLAERSLEYFIAKQHEDGFMQNFGGYMLETGAALWSMGEHYRYTHDNAWVRRIEIGILKACDYVIRWSQRNQIPEFQGKGYGMIDGKVGDPEDPYHIFMLNGYAYLGLSRAAEMLAEIEPFQSSRLENEAQKLKGFIRTALNEAIAQSPVISLGDGSWVPSVPPWPEYTGPVSLFAEGGNWYTHGMFSGRDSLVGPLYLVFQEVVGLEEPWAKWMLASHAELMTERNAAFSQPYYSRHDWVHLKRGEVKPFLKTYYNTLAGLADRETYTFWEHYQQISPHKTHEEGWFLMQTRWMLYLEEGSSLRLLAGIPRAWLKDGKQITIEGMASYFGKLYLRVDSQVGKGMINASIEVRGNKRLLERVVLRLPHPAGKPALSCRSKSSTKNVQYDPIRETVIIAPWTGEIDITLGYE